MSQLDRRSFLKLSSATLIGVTMGGVSLNAVAQEAVASGVARLPLPENYYS